MLVWEPTRNMDGYSGTGILKTDCINAGSNGNSQASTTTGDFQADAYRQRILGASCIRVGERDTPSPTCNVVDSTFIEQNHPETRMEPCINTFICSPSAAVSPLNKPNYVALNCLYQDSGDSADCGHETPLSTADKQCCRRSLEHPTPLIPGSSTAAEYSSHASICGTHTTNPKDVECHASGTLATETPNLIDELPYIHSKLANKALCVFLDYDGTLTPIVSDPRNANLSTELRETIERLAEKYPVSIVTGRKLETIRGFVRLRDEPDKRCLMYAASHGFDIDTAGCGPKLHYKVGNVQVEAVRSCT